jgi:hypothetical protein
VYNAPTSAKFIGDLPHTWVGSDCVRSGLDLFAYERGGDSSLVIAAGALVEWMREGAVVSVRKLSTAYGPLSCAMRERKVSWSFESSGSFESRSVGLCSSPPVPRLGAADLSNARVNGARVDADPYQRVTLRRLPAEVGWKATRSGPPMDR